MRLFFVKLSASEFLAAFAFRNRNYVHFYSTLSYLQSLGLILLISTKVGKTYTNQIRPLFDQGLFEAVWQARFG